MQLTKCSILETFHKHGKPVSIADMLSRSFIKTELQTSQINIELLLPLTDFANLQSNANNLRFT